MYSEHQCNDCGRPAEFFTEIYDPRRKGLITYYFCEDCQVDVAEWLSVFGGTFA